MTSYLDLKKKVTVTAWHSVTAAVSLLPETTFSQICLP